VSCLLHVQAAGLKHIGFGPFKRENQDEFFIQVGDFGGVTGGNLFCVFDGHGTHGKDAALYSRQLLPRLLDVELRKYFMVSTAHAWSEAQTLVRFAPREHRPGANVTDLCHFGAVAALVHSARLLTPCHWVPCLYHAACGPRQ
jgi:hypothetical protein